MTESQDNASGSVAKSELKNAVSDAQFLLAFASRNGKILSKETINIVVKSGQQSEMSESEETSFWKHFVLLTTAVAPVSAESVRAISAMEGKKSLVQKTVRRYTVTTIIALVFLVALQAYWAVGALIISDVRVTQTQLDEVEMNIKDGRFSSDVDVSEQTSSQNGKQKPPQTSKQQDGVSERQELTEKKDNLNLNLTTNYRLLKQWGWIQSRILGIDKLYNSKEKPDDEIKENKTYLHCATFTMDILQKYILPLIYGFLGACVYILRNLSSKIKAYAFINASVINYYIRMCLGTLGGIAIVWFVSPEKSTDPVMSLSPLALAFLVGYSVELLFTVMDTLINAFTGNRPSSTKVETHV